MSALHDKIRKLLALAHDDGATEHEASRAMELATALMLKHNISQEEVGEKPTVCRGNFYEIDKRWEKTAARASGHLYAVRPLYYGESMTFVGRADNIDAAQQTFEMIKDQIELLYKQSLPRGMSQRARAEYRRDFKEMCAAKVYHRAVEIVHNLQKEDVAQSATGSTALVVVNARKQLESEVEDFFQSLGVVKEKSRAVSVRSSRGAADGLRQGEKVQLNRRVG